MSFQLTIDWNSINKFFVLFLNLSQSLLYLVSLLWILNQLDFSFKLPFLKLVLNIYIRLNKLFHVNASASICVDITKYLLSYGAYPLIDDLLKHFLVLSIQIKLLIDFSRNRSHHGVLVIFQIELLVVEFLFGFEQILGELVFGDRSIMVNVDLAKQFGHALNIFVVLSSLLSYFETWGIVIFLKMGWNILNTLSEIMVLGRMVDCLVGRGSSSGVGGRTSHSRDTISARRQLEI